MAASEEGPTNPIQTEAISEECKDDDAMTSTHHTCANDPDFAVICAFLQKFAKDLGLNLPNFKNLQDWLTNNDEGELPKGHGSVQKYEILIIKLINMCICCIKLLL